MVGEPGIGLRGHDQFARPVWPDAVTDRPVEFGVGEPLRLRREIGRVILRARYVQRPAGEIGAVAAGAGGHEHETPALGYRLGRRRGDHGAWRRRVTGVQDFLRSRHDPGIDQRQRRHSDRGAGCDPQRSRFQIEHGMCSYTPDEAAIYSDETPVRDTSGDGESASFSCGLRHA